MSDCKFGFGYDCDECIKEKCTRYRIYQQGILDAESKYICHEDCTSENCSMCIRWNRLSDCYEVEK